MSWKKETRSTTLPINSSIKALASILVFLCLVTGDSYPKQDAPGEELQIVQVARVPSIGADWWMLEWNSVPGEKYRVQVNSGKLDADSFSDLSGDWVEGESFRETTQAYFTNTPGDHAFYRIRK